MPLILHKQNYLAYTVFLHISFLHVHGVMPVLVYNFSVKAISNVYNWCVLMVFETVVCEH